jgi:hypothetical protein
MMMHADPMKELSPIIKRQFKPLDNPALVLELLQGIRTIKEGVVGNDVTTGLSQCNHWRGCLAGTALKRFNMFAVQVGTETIPNLNQVERQLVAFFAPPKVLLAQKKHMCLSMRKPKDVSTRQNVGAVATLNDNLVKLPPDVDAAQKLPNTDTMDLMASRAPKNHNKSLLADHGFDPHAAAADKFIELSERAGTKDAIIKGRSAQATLTLTKNVTTTRSPRRSPRPTSQFCCREHAPKLRG